MTAPLTIVDAFTSRAFGGNPAAVCVLAAPGDEAWMRLVARELAMPATTFLHPNGDGYGLRWFTATTELELCGHGTLASAHVLWDSGRLSPDRAATFQTRGGTLSARRRGDWIELNFPATPAVEASAPAGLIETLGVTPRWIGRSRLDHIVEVDDEQTVRDLQPDFARLREVQTRGVIVTSRSATSDRDFVSRFFAPSTGLNEDPHQREHLRRALERAVAADHARADRVRDERRRDGDEGDDTHDRFECFTHSCVGDVLRYYVRVGLRPTSRSLTH